MIFNNNDKLWIIFFCITISFFSAFKAKLELKEKVAMETLLNGKKKKKKETLQCI